MFQHLRAGNLWCANASLVKGKDVLVGYVHVPTPFSPQHCSGFEAITVMLLLVMEALFWAVSLFIKRKFSLSCSCILIDAAVLLITGKPHNAPACCSYYWILFNWLHSQLTYLLIWCLVFIRKSFTYDSDRRAPSCKIRLVWKQSSSSVTSTETFFSDFQCKSDLYK